MKDKEKQIEEIGKDVCENINTKMCANGTCPKIWDCPYSNTMAEILISKGYRKLPEDSVVLSREEYQKEKLKLFAKAYNQGSKETAEKFARDIFNHITTSEVWERLRQQWLSKGGNFKANKHIYDLLIEPIATKFGVEIKE